MKPRLIFALWLALSSLAWGQVDVPEQTAVNRIATLRATNEIPEDAKVKRRWSTSNASLDIVASEAGDVAYVTAGKSGRYAVVLTEAVANGDNLTLEDYSATVVFGEPGPEPEPSLRDLVPDDKTAKLLRELYADMSEVVAMTTDPSVAKFWEMHNAFYLKMREDNNLPSNPRLGVALTERINKLLGMATTINTELRAKLAEGLLAIAGAFGQPDTPPDIPGPDDPLPVPAEVAYVYEKDDTAIPPPVQAGLNRLNRERGILATAIDQDVKDGEGQVPDQYRIAIEAAKQAGLPALVAWKDDEVLKVIKDPRTEVQVWGISP